MDSSAKRKSIGNPVISSFCEDIFLDYMIDAFRQHIEANGHIVRETQVSGFGRTMIQFAR